MFTDDTAKYVSVFRKPTRSPKTSVKFNHTALRYFLEHPGSQFWFTDLDVYLYELNILLCSLGLKCAYLTSCEQKLGLAGTFVVILLLLLSSLLSSSSSSLGTV